VLGCSLALVLSLWVGKTHEALMCTYAVWCLWLLAGPMIRLLASTVGWPWMSPPWKSEPFSLAMAPYWWPGSVGWSDYLLFLAVTCLISALLLGVAMLRIRSVCSRDSVRKPRRSTSSSSGWNIWRLVNRTIPWLTPSLDGNPVVWREWHRSRPSRWMMLVTFVYAGLSLLFSVVTILWPGGAGSAIVNALQVSVGLLLLSVMAVTSLAEERVRGSLDLLLSTPLSTRQIVMGKWLGAFRFVPLLAVLPAVVIWATGYMSGAENWWAFLLMIAFVLSAGAAVTSLGLAMAVEISRLGRAVGSTVAVYVLVTIGWIPLVGLMYGPRSERLMLASPIFWAFWTTLEALQKRMPERTVWELFWIIFYGLGAAGLFLSTLSSFDRRLGRTDDAMIQSRTSSRWLRMITAIYSVFAIFFTFFLLGSPPDSTSLPFGSGLIFSLGLLLLALSAAWPLAAVPSSRDDDLKAITGLSTARTLFARWAAAGGLAPGIVVPPLLVACCSSGLRSFDWLPLVILVVFMLSVCAATVSLGVAILAWCPRGVWAVVVMASLWGLTNGAWSTLGNMDLLDPRNQALASCHPFFGVVTLTFWMNGTTAGDFRAVAWAIGASAVYAASAGLLIAVALSRHNPSITRLIRFRPASTVLPNNKKAPTKGYP